MTRQHTDIVIIRNMDQSLMQNRTVSNPIRRRGWMLKTGDGVRNGKAVTCREIIPDTVSQAHSKVACHLFISPGSSIAVSLIASQ